MHTNSTTLVQILSGDFELTDSNFISTVAKVISEIEIQGILSLIYWLIVLILVLFAVITLLEICNLTCTILNRRKTKKYYRNLHNNGIDV